MTQKIYNLIIQKKLEHDAPLLSNVFIANFATHERRQRFIHLMGLLCALDVYIYDIKYRTNRLL